MTYDCLVIGVGGFGAAALHQLARRGLRVLGIDQFGLAHDRGSSHGETRIIRKAYFEHPDYVPLLHQAYALWQELEQEAGRRLYVETGLIVSGTPDRGAVPGALESARLHQLDVCLLSASEARRSYPAFHFPNEHQVVLEPHAGYLMVEECVRTFVERARLCGGEVRWQETVREWGDTGYGVWVQTDRGRYEASHAVITGGAWIQRLLPGILPRLKVLRKVQFWHPLGEEKRGTANSILPFFFDFSFEFPGGAFYGIPSSDRVSLKVAEHSGGTEITDPDSLDRRCHDDDRRPVQQFLQQILPSVPSPPLRYSVCMYTMSPDGHFIVGSHPEYPRVVFAGGFSGHGFKFTPVLGRALADMVVDGNTPLPIRFLSLDRFK